MNDKESILTLNENENGTSAVSDGYNDGYCCEASAIDDSILGADDPSVYDGGAVADFESFRTENEREEYERLIKTRFKELFAEDTQRLINKRFKKYKSLEEKVKRLEDEARKYSDVDSLLAAERECAVRETEERLKLQFKAMRGRAAENAILPRMSRPSFDVSRLTKSERASLASRAFKGEKIQL